MHAPHRLFTLLLAATACPAVATDLPLSFTADGSSRWYEFHVNTFAQLDRPTGAANQHHLFSIDAEPNPFNPTVFQSIGDARVFPSGSAFTDIGVLSYAGTGSGTFPITGVELDVYPFVATDLGVLTTNYRTTVLNPVGTVTIADGVVADIQLSAGIRFEYNVFFIPSMGWTPFDGTMFIDGNQYRIFVDDTYDYSHGSLRYAWDLSGTVNGVGTGDVIFKSGFEQP